jgi:hypothetical protein
MITGLNIQDTIKPVQDTIRPVLVVPKDTSKQSTDTSIQIITPPVYRKVYKQPEIITQITDTTSVCERNPISDITFYDSLNYISERKLIKSDPFPVIFLQKNQTILQEARTVLLKNLRNGEKVPVPALQHDWLLAVFIISVFIYSLIRTTSAGIFNELGRFFFFRGINDPASRDMGGLFNWQATLLNLVTFFNLGLFAYFAAAWYDFIPAKTAGILVWMISVGIIIVAVTLRHFIIIITGNISDQKEIFREYLLGVYHSHRLGAIILFFIVVLISYTDFLSVRLLIRAGSIALILMYLIRILRLFLIFINRNVSIFYLILYLCALEILPVLILLKYSAGLF